MAYRTMRRATLQPRLDAQQREQASKVYEAIGLPMPPAPEDQQDQDAIQPELLTRSHNGSEIVTTFVPTPKLPTLNAVHGPLANKSGMQVDIPVVGFPIVGAGTMARSMSGESDNRKGRRQGSRKSSIQEMEDERKKKREEVDVASERIPYFYPRRDWKASAIKKRRQKEKSKILLNLKRSQSLNEAGVMEIENSA